MDIFEVIEEGDLESLKKLISGGADVEARNRFSTSCSRDLEIINFSVDEGVEVGNLFPTSWSRDLEIINFSAYAEPGYGNTPLIVASQHGYFEIVKYLIEKCNANVEARNKDGNTPLIYASKNDHFKIVKCLIENGANYEELLERLEKEGLIKKIKLLEKIILEVADSRVKFITSDKY